MPNHVQSRLVIKGEESLLTQIKNDISTDVPNGKPLCIDFNKIVPMPESLDIEDSSTVSDGMKYLKTLGKKKEDLTADELFFLDMFKKKDAKHQDEAIRLGNIALANVEKYGYATWYNWRRNNWGTKWNAYETSYVESEDKQKLEIWFQTAWCAPFQVIVALSLKYPNARFELTYADEDTSYNCGEVHFENGEDVYCNQPEGGSFEAYEIVFELAPDLRQEYRLVDGKYEYIDED